MITNEEILIWLKSIYPANYYSGVLDNLKEKSICITNFKRPNETALGGRILTNSHSKGINLLIHWTNSTRETENAAIALYEQLADTRYIKLNNHNINYIQLLNNGPVNMGQNDGIYEYVIEFILWYTNNN